MDILPPHLIGVITPAERHVALLWEMVDNLDQLWDFSAQDTAAIKHALKQMGEQRTELARLKAQRRVL